MSLNHKSQELRAVEKQVEELRVLNFKLSEQLKEISKSKKIKNSNKNSNNHPNNHLSKNLSEKMISPELFETSKPA